MTARVLLMERMRTATVLAPLEEVSKMIHVRFMRVLCKSDILLAAHGPRTVARVKNKTKGLAGN